MKGNMDDEGKAQGSIRTGAEIHNPKCSSSLGRPAQDRNEMLHKADDVAPGARGFTVEHMGIDPRSIHITMPFLI